MKISDEEILQGLREGKTQIQIAEKYNVSAALINRRIKQIDCQLVEEAKSIGKPKKLSHSTRRKIQDEEILQRLREGKSQTQIAEEYGIDNAVISRRIRLIDPNALIQALLEGRKNRTKNVNEKIGGENLSKLKNSLQQRVLSQNTIK